MHSHRTQAHGLLVAFSFAVFLNAALLFAIQPIFTRMALPLLGGTPAVWNTCLVFFQAVLLGGYLYAHLTSKWLTVKAQAVLHLLLLCAAVFVLPVGIPESWSMAPVSERPLTWLLGLLTVSLGLPFFLLSAGAPMMQRWFAGTHHSRAHNPYFLYAASNLGSFATLLAYPTIIEPRMALSAQSITWVRFYYALLGTIGICALSALIMSARSATTGDKNNPMRPSTSILWRQRVRWMALSFAPSSLLIGVTTYLSVDVASFPFLWILPLALYLLTFVLVFADRQVISRDLTLHAQLLLGLVLVVSLCLPSDEAIIGPAILHLAAFLVTGLMCHGQLSDRRPTAEHLTEFYLWMSLGGVLGGVFSVIVAPLIFETLVEYLLTLALAFALRQRPPAYSTAIGERLRDVMYPAGLALLIVAAYRLPLPPNEWFREGTTVFVLGAMFVVFFFWKRPIRLALGTIAMYAGFAISGHSATSVVYRERSFFGSYQVLRVKEFHVLQHGTTSHGGQNRNPDHRTEPLTYYYRGSPISDVFAHLVQKPIRRVAIIGLGAGAIACYGRPDESWTFYEIDPVVARIARTPDFFSYLRDCSPRTDIVIGDARLTIANALDHEFDLLIIDAFSSDAVPVHLMTREAIKLYLKKLQPDGVIAFHISNRFVNLAPVLSVLARDASLAGMDAERSTTTAESSMLYSGSRWVVMAPSRSAIAGLSSVKGWRPLVAAPGVRLWTDDYTDVLSAIKW